MTASNENSRYSNDDRIFSFYRAALGYAYRQPDDFSHVSEEITKAAEKMPSYPLNGYASICDGTIVVKLSD